MSRKIALPLAIGLGVLVGVVAPSQAVVLIPGESARIDFTATTGTTPFDFVTFSLNFSSSNPFGPNETLSYTSFSSGHSIYTSGLFGQLTRNAIVPISSSLATNSFSVLVTAQTGSFELIAATADFEHILTSGTNQLGVAGTITAIPETSTWALMMLGFAGRGFGAHRTRRDAAPVGAVMRVAPNSQPNRPNKRLE